MKKTPTVKLNAIKAFAFDLDGTLVDSVADLAASANAMREQLNMPPLDEERIKSHVGDGIASLVHRALTDSREQQADEALWTKGFSLFVTHYYEHLTDYTKPYPHVETTLALLKTLGFPLVVITNKNERFATKILEKLNLLDYFSLVIGGDTLPEKKPSILPLIHTCEVLNIESEELAMIGDSKNDIFAAKNAGSLAIGANYGYEDITEYEPDIVIEQFFELYDMLNPKKIKH